MGTSMALRIADVPVSRSTSTVFPCRESASEKLMAKVVLPTPPLPDEIGMIRLMATRVSPSLSRTHRGNRRQLLAAKAPPGLRTSLRQNKSA